MASAIPPARQLFLHASALEKDGRGIVIAGDKGAGKTTMLIGLLRQAGARYVSNDRVMVSPISDPPALHGVPTVVTIRTSTLEMFPDLHSRLRASGYDVLLTLEEAAEQPVLRAATQQDAWFALSPAQFCSLVRVSAAGSSRARSLVFPLIAPGARSWWLNELSAEAAARRLSVRGAHRESAAPGLFGDRGDSELRTGSLIRRFTSQVRCVECVLGPDAYSDEPAGELLRQLSD